MSRKARKLGDSGVYHVILRGNDRQNLFYDNSDREFFINRIFKYTKESQIELYAFCLMDNHVHILLGNGNESMALFVKKLACSYVYRFNHKYERTGHLFQGRYKSELVDTTDYFMTVYRYILKNPEKAGICSYMKYEWSSLRMENTCDVINSAFILSIFGNRNNKSVFLNMDNDDVCMEDVFVEESQKNKDDLIILFIKQLFGIENVLELRKSEPDVKKYNMRLLKKCGMSVNLISRLTAINRYFIRNA